MNLHLAPYLLCLSAFVGALLLSLFATPRIIFVTSKKRLFDQPDKRKIHKNITPNLGGVAIFFSFMIITALLIEPTMFAKWNYFAAACLILFLTGIKDDLVTIPPYKKLIAQIVASFIVVFFADARLRSLEGFLGIHELPYWFSVLFSVVGCTFMTNAFNLIDGVDGLAATIGMMACMAFGALLYVEGNYSLAIMAFSLMGAIAGFLRFNISPARIFMGDTGSMVIGFSISVIAIFFIKSFEDGTRFASLIHSRSAALLLALAFLFIPVFDTFRVFSTRAIKGHSPFRPDRTHLHHYLLDLGYGHRRTVRILFTANIVIIGIALLMQDYNLNIAFATIFIVAYALFSVLFFLRRKAAHRMIRQELEQYALPVSKELSPSVALSADRNESVQFREPMRKLEAAELPKQP